MSMSMKELEELAQTGATIEIPWQEIRPNPKNPRTYFDPTKMTQLTASIGRVGQRKPVEVTPIFRDSQHKWQLITGERRLRACTTLKRSVRAQVMMVDDPDYLTEHAILENCNRDGLNVLDTAKALETLQGLQHYRSLPTKGARIAAMAESMGMSTTRVIQHLLVLRLHPKLRPLVAPPTPKAERLPLQLAARLGRLTHTMQLAAYADDKARGLRTGQAIRFLSNEAIEQGTHKGRQGRKPSDDFDIFNNQLCRMVRDGSDMLDMPPEKFDRMIELRNDLKRKSVKFNMDNAWEIIGRLRDRLRFSLERAQKTDRAAS